AAEPECGGTTEWHQEFEQRTAEDHQHIAETRFLRSGKNAEKRMARFVNRKIGVIKEKEPAAAEGGIEKEGSGADQREPAHPPGHGLPPPGFRDGGGEETGALSHATSLAAENPTELPANAWHRQKLTDGFAQAPPQEKRRQPAAQKDRAAGFNHAGHRS